MKDKKRQKGTTQKCCYLPEEKYQQKRKQAIGDIKAFLIRLAVVILTGWVLLGVIFGVAVMEGEDMYPRIRDGDLMIYFRMQKDYHQGDVVIFSQGERQYVGRIVALGGDTVNINEEGELLINGNVQDEEIFYPTQKVDETINFPCQIPGDSVFLLSDFRTNGTDSRSYGPIAIKELDGKVITILRRRGI